MSGDAPDWSWWFSRLLAASHGVEAEIPDTRQRLERARSLMHARFADSLDLEVIAREAYFSQFHFARAFRREFGVPPHRYLTHRRIERAKELLQRTDLSVTQVCFDVGFSSLGSFSTMFQRHVGHSPNRYRARIVQSLGVPTPMPMIPSCFLAKFGRPARVGVAG